MLKRFLRLLKAPLWGLLFLLSLPAIGIATVSYHIADSLWNAMEKLYEDPYR